jgi:hypothetical protein
MGRSPATSGDRQRERDCGRGERRGAGCGEIGDSGSTSGPSARSSSRVRSGGWARRLGCRASEATLRGPLSSERDPHQEVDHHAQAEPEPEHPDQNLRRHPGDPPHPCLAGADEGVVGAAGPGRGAWEGPRPLDVPVAPGIPRLIQRVAQRRCAPGRFGSLASRCARLCQDSREITTANVAGTRGSAGRRSEAP